MSIMRRKYTTRHQDNETENTFLLFSLPIDRRMIKKLTQKNVLGMFFFNA